jgi:flagellar basal-body rod protein FlgB
MTLAAHAWHASCYVLVIQTDLRAEIVVNGLNAEMGFFEHALNLRAYRQQLLAGNIANADTPNYKAVDIDFAQALQSAKSAQAQVPLARTEAAHMQAQGGNPLNVKILYRQPMQPSIDGNTVDTDVENAQFTDNAIHYQANLTFITGQIKTMLSAIQGQ